MTVDLNLCGNGRIESGTLNSRHSDLLLHLDLHEHKDMVTLDMKNSLDFVSGFDP